MQAILGESERWQWLAGEQVWNTDLLSILVSVREAGAPDVVSQAFAAISHVFGGVIALFVVLILSYYMVVEEHGLTRGLEHIIPRRHHVFLQTCIKDGKDKVGHWMHGQLLLMLLVGLLYYALLSALGVPFALVLALFGALLEIIPYVGPNLAALPAFLIGFSISPALAVLVLLGYFVIQQIESNILTPKIMQKVVGLNPILSIIAILCGFQLAGILGALLSIPLAVLAVTILKEWARQYRPTS